MLLVVLSEVAQHKDNLMDSHNLGLIFAPHLLKCNQGLNGTLCIGGTLAEGIEDMVAYTEFIINNADTVFQVVGDWGGSDSGLGAFLLLQGNKVLESFELRKLED